MFRERSGGASKEATGRISKNYNINDNNTAHVIRKRSFCVLSAAVLAQKGYICVNDSNSDPSKGALNPSNCTNELLFTAKSTVNSSKARICNDDA